MIRIGIAGIGFMGMTHYLTYQKIRGAKVAALCEQDAKRLAGDWRSIKGNFGPPGEIMDLGAVARYADLDAMIADPTLDLIDICLPPSWHARTAVAALEAGRHVFCEKPIALSPSDATRMVEAADRAGKLLMIGHVLPFFPEYKFARETIAGGKYGKLLGGHFKRIVSVPTWLPDFFDPKKVGGPMLDLHVHDAHFIRLLFGMPKAVQTLGTMRGEVAERFATQFIYDPPRMVTAASGVIGQQGRPFTHAYEIYLEKATLFFDYMAHTGGRRRDHACHRIARQRQGFAAEVGRRADRRLLGRVDRGGSIGADKHRLVAFGRRVGPRRGRPLPKADRVDRSRPGGEDISGQFMGRGFSVTGCYAAEIAMRQLKVEWRLSVIQHEPL